MFTSNAKYEKKQGGPKNKRFLPGNGYQTGLDASDFDIPRYEEMKFLKLEDFEE